MGGSHTHHARSILIAAVQALFCCVLASGAYAKPIKQEFQDLKITYTAAKAGTDANNIYLVLVDATGKPLGKLQVNVAADGFVVSADSSSFELTPKNAIADGSKVTLRIKSGSYAGKIGVQSAIFRSGVTHVGVGEATGGALAGDPMYTISDDVIGSPDLMVEDLTFYENHAPVDFATLDPSLPIDMSGIAEPDVMLDGAGTSDPFTIPPIAGNDYFIAQGEVVDEDTGLPVAWFVDGYTTAAVPEPEIWSLMLLGLGGLGAVLRGARGKSSSLTV